MPSGQKKTVSVGRPTKLTDAVRKKAALYPTEYESYGHAIPSEVGLAKILRVARSTVQKWGKDDPKGEFSGILEQIQCNQEFQLLNSGLLGDYNSTIVKLVLGKHGYSDKQDATVETSINPLTVVVKS